MSGFSLGSLAALIREYARGSYEVIGFSAPLDV
jgi:hypothetical protein